MEDNVKRLVREGIQNFPAVAGMVGIRGAEEAYSEALPLIIMSCEGRCPDKGEVEGIISEAKRLFSKGM